MPLRACNESCTTLSCWASMNFCTAPSGRLNSSTTSCGSSDDPNASLMRSTDSTMYVSEFFSRSAICVPTSVPIAPTKMPAASMTLNRISAVALPRRHPRRARRLTPGSIARARNRAITSSIIRPSRRDQRCLTRPTTMKPIQNTAIARITQPGTRCGSESVGLEADPADGGTSSGRRQPLGGDEDSEGGSSSSDTDRA